MNSLYKERLLEIYAERKHFGELKEKTHIASMKSPVCDDEIKVELRVEDGKIVDARFFGKSCFVSTISAEVLMEKIIGMRLDDAMKLTKENLDDFLEGEIVATRIGCELFPLEVLKKVKEVED